jgi:prepilin-type N-terminal cleavage/methylation domain-containing protein
MNLQQRQTENGFTLLEVLVAAAIFAIGLLAVASMQSNAITGNSFSQRHSVATAVAQGALESLMSLDKSNAIFNPPGVAANTPLDLDPQTAATTLTVNGGTYSATFRTQPNTPVTSVTTVTVTITGPGTPPGNPPPGLVVTNFKRTI